MKTEKMDTFSNTARLVFLLLIVLVSSCSPPLYIPDSVQVSTLTEQHETELSTTLGTNGIDITGAYAITNSIAVQLKGSAMFPITGPHFRSLLKKYAEIGLGYTYVNTNRTKLYSLFSGAGYGISSGTDSPDELYIFGSDWLGTQTDYLYRTKGNYSKYWIQPNIGFLYGAKSNIELLISTRFNFIYFHSLDFNYFNDYESNESLYEPHIVVDPHGFNYNFNIEPVCTFKVGSKKVMFISQLGISIPTIKQKTTQFKSRLFIANIGLELNLFSKDKNDL